MIPSFSGRRAIIAITFTFALLANAWGAQGHPSSTTFGPEFEFLRTQWQEDDGARIADEMRQAREMLIEKIAAYCARTRQCFAGSGHITFNDGFWFYVSSDLGVIEVTASPMTIADFKRKYRARLQRYLFDIAAGLDLRPLSKTYGGGHIHIGVESSGMGENPILLRNFIVDFMNHAELASGVLENDPINALAVADGPRMAKDAIRAAIAEFDASAMTTAEAWRLIEAINAAYELNPKNRAKHQALNLLHIRPDHQRNDAPMRLTGTIEIRSLRSQESAGAFGLLIELFQGRLDFLRATREPIAVGKWTRIRTNAEKLRRFHEYVVQSGKTWKRYRSFAPSEIRRTERESMLAPSKCIRDIERLLLDPAGIDR